MTIKTLAPLALLVLVACQPKAPAVRTEVETVVTGTPSTGKLAYLLPAGWRDQGPSGMRLTTLFTPAGHEVAISLLPGSGGDLEGNFKRWLGQLGQNPSPDALHRFLDSLARESHQGGELVVADLGVFVTEEGSPSMVVALWRTPEGLVTVKLTGPKGPLARDMQAFTALAHSLKAKP